MIESLQWDGDRVRSIVRAAVGRKRHMFQLWPDLGAADLEQEGMIRAAAVHPKFQPGKGSYTTLITTAANRAMIDLWRSRRRQTEKEAVLRTFAWAMQPGRDDRGDGSPQNAFGWLIAVYAACRGMLARPRRGNPGHPVARRLAAGILMRKMRLSSRGAQMLFTQRADLRSALGFVAVPSHFWFARAVQCVTDSRKISRGLKALSPTNADRRPRRRISGHAQGQATRSAIG